MDARGAAEVEVPRAPVTVGVIDTGIDAEQPDLAGRVDTSRSVSCDVNGIPNVSEEALRYNDIHGTHIAGIIAANHNDIGIDGIAPDATLVSIRSSPVEWCNRFVSFGLGYALSWSGVSSCWVGWGVSRDLVRMSRLR